MSRFGDFTLLEDLGRSATADRYKANHVTLGGPFFLKVHRRLEPGHLAELQGRGDRLIGQSHPNLAPHLGHGVVDGIGFTVSPWLEGLDLVELSASLKDRRVNLTLDQCLLIVGDLGAAVAALHGIAAGPGVTTARLAHGDVSLGHVRVGPEGQVWLTGLCTPRGLLPGRIPEARFDLAGVGALLYDLVPLLRGGAARPPLPTILDRVIRRALGIGPASEHLTPVEFSSRLGEVFTSLKLNADRAPLVDVIRRTIRAVEKKLLEQGARPAGRSAADAIPELLPVSSPSTAGAHRGVARLEPLDLPPERTRASAPLPVSTPSMPPMPPVPPAPAPPAMVPLASLVPLVPLAPLSAANLPLPSTLAPLPGHPSLPPQSSFLTGSAARSPSATGIFGIGTPLSSPGAAPPRPPGVPSSSTPAPFLPPPAPQPATLPSLFGTPPSPFGAAPSRADSGHFNDPFAMPSAPRVGPRPATMAALPTPTAAEMRSFEFGSLDMSAPTPSRQAMPLTDSDERPLRPLPASLLMVPPLSTVPPPLSTPPKAIPRPPINTINSALNERTDPDATRPLRIAAQKSLPAVQVLLNAGIVSADHVEIAATEQASRGGRTLEILVSQGACSDADIADALARATGRPRLADDAVVVKDTALLKRLPQTYALARRLLPLALDGGTLVLAVADPFDQKVIDEVRDLVHAIGVDVRVTARAALTQGTLRAFSELSGGSLTATGPRVLLGIQDDEQASKLGARLAQEGMQIEHVVDGITARQILLSRPPDALICTWDLPKIDGQALLLAARANERTLELPFFVIGPRGDDDLMAKVLDLGADDYFNDPVRPDVVVAKLRRAVGKLVGRVSQPPVAAPVVVAVPPPRPKPKPTSPPPLPKKQPVLVAPLGDDFAFDDLPDLPPEYDDDGTDVPSMPTGVMGTLRQMALPEIVQSLEMGRKTASVDIVPADGEKGSIAFEQGAVRFAECGTLIGDQAFFALLRHKDGFFRIHYGDAPKSINIESPTTFLLLEAMRLMDEEGL